MGSPEDHVPMSPAGAPGNLQDTVYAHLRAIAQHQMNNERAAHTLSATALVHEAYLRLAPGPMSAPASAAFYHAAAQAMRRILVDHARRRGAAKRGGGRRATLDIRSVLDLTQDVHLDSALALESAYLRLEEEDAQAAAVVRLCFYAGLTGEQAATVLGIAARQADRAWAFARAFLADKLRTDGAAEGE